MNTRKYTKSVVLETKRLKLRQWIPEDYKCFAQMSADSKVMEYFPRVLSEEESNVVADKVSTLINSNGWGFWALELLSEGRFIGFVGLHRLELEYPFSPGVEIGWRLSREFWGRGYASEAANAALQFAFRSLGLNEVVSFTAVRNKRSEAVMKKIGMIDARENFNHPNLPFGDPLREHVLYRIARSQWENV